MSILRQALAIARLEATLFTRFPKLRVSVVGILVIPALYALIYLSSVWDPASHTGALPAAIVNLDAGIEYRGQSANVGRDVAASLQDKHLFGFVPYTSEMEARQAVRDGKLAFALIIPQTFSANAVPGTQSGGGKLVVYTSEGNNYTGAGFAKRFASELGHQVNETLNEKRWQLVLNATAGSQDSVARLRDGVAQLRGGAHELEGGLVQAATGATTLAGGSQRLNEGVGQLTGGVKQIGAGIRSMDARKPQASDLAALKGGGAQLVAGHVDLGRGLEELEGGATKLTEGAVKMRDETQSIPLVGGRVSAGAQQLADGGSQLRGGLQAARAGQAKLAEGATRLAAGVNTLTDGVSALTGGIGTIATRLPEDAKLDELAAGGNALAQGAQGLQGGVLKLRDGSHRLAAGLDLLAGSLPANVQGLEGNARGLANSVEPEIEVVAPVPNNGTGFAPNFIPVALWLGAVMTAFIFHLRQLPVQAQGAPRLSQLMGKLAIPSAIVLGQALVVMLMLTLLLDVRVANLASFGLTLGLASLTFMLIIVALTRAFGDAGKALALILLILQLSSAGGVFPIELSSTLFRDLNPWLPFTWVVRAFRASMFGAYDNAWLSSWLVVVLAAFVAFCVATWVGRWKLVEPQDHRPALDL